MKGSQSQPKIFISYSWSSPQHEMWVLELSERLSSDGIIVILDKWDLKEGQDKHVFMEQMVNDKDIKKVLVICETGYQLKADERKGGVGTETQLISKEVYDKTDQEKFIPIVREYKDGHPCIPHFIASRIFIDLSKDEIYEENYQRLVRNLYDKPILKRPVVGVPPAYITEDEPVTLKTSHKVNEIKNSIINDRKNTEGLVYDYLDIFTLSLEDFRLSGGSEENFDDQVISSIEKMLPLRDDFIDFVFTTFKYQKSVDLEKFQAFFERLISFSYRPEHIQSGTEIDYDNYKFFTYEIILYFFTILVQLKKYNEIGFFVNQQYFYRYPNTGELTHNGIGIFNLYSRALEEFRNRRLELRRVSLTADLIKARATRKDITFEEVKQTDLILYYITELQNSSFGWFPRTSVYNQRGGSIDIFERMISSHHFEKIKSIFDIQSLEQLRTLMETYIKNSKDKTRRYSGLWDYDIQPIENVINLSKVATLK